MGIFRPGLTPSYPLRKLLCYGGSTVTYNLLPDRKNLGLHERPRDPPRLFLLHLPRCHLHRRHNSYSFTPQSDLMPFIELTGQTLLDVINDGEINPEELRRAGVTSTSVLRVNEHGELEIRKRNGWELIGGLLGNYEDRLRKVTGYDWV